MKSLLYYLIQVTVSSGILYSYYHFVLRNKKFHIYNRFYLLIAATISILIPFLNIPVYFSASETNSSFVLKTITSISSNDFAEPVSSSIPIQIKNSFFSTGNLVYYCYAFVSVIMIIRILFSLERIRQLKKKYTVQKLNTVYFVNTNEPGAPFSFFRWLFWNQKIELRSGKGEQIFRHELFHIEQKHSLDILYMELLTTIFWINPFLHLIKKEIKVIHEFLADQFATNQSKNWEYAELLLMQSLNTQHHLTNPFFYNQIKRRIAMITSSQKTSYQYLRKIMVLPVAAIVVALFAFSYKNKKENTFPTAMDKPVTVVIDAGHGMDPSGAPTGVAASDGSYEDDIVLSIAKKVKELNTNDRLQIVLTRETENTVDLKKRVEFSNSQNANLFISLHTNAASTQGKDAEGMDILFSGKNTKYYAENKILATILYNYFHQIHPVNEIQSSKNGIYVIDSSRCPSVLIECGYLTDPKDLAFVKDQSGQVQIAQSILQSIEQYFSQKDMPDWEQRKKAVSDTTPPVIKFTRNSVNGKMEGSYNGKKFNKMTEYEGHFAFYFDDEASTMIMIGKEQTEELKKKYGKSLNELIIKDPEKEKAEENEQKELKEMLEEKQLQSKKEQIELKHLMEKKLVEQENQVLEMEKAELEFKQLTTQKQQAIELEQLEFKKRIDTMQNQDREETMKKFKLLMDNKQRDAEKFKKEFEQMMLMKQQETEKTAEELKDIMIELDQKEFNKKMLEKQLEIEEKSKTDEEKSKANEEKSKTNSKKVKS